MSGRRILALGLVAIGALLFAGSLMAMSGGMRNVMVENGGFCASGGPYEIAQGHQCDGSVAGAIVGGTFGLLIGGALLVVASGFYGGGRMIGLVGILWAALFGVLGFNFIQLGLNPPEGSSSSGTVAGWLIPGVLFWLMALPGLIGGGAAIFWRRDTSAEPALAGGDPTAGQIGIVRANVGEDVRAEVLTIPGLAASTREQSPEQAPAPRLPWLVALTAGSVAGVVLGLQLVERTF